MTSNDSWYVRGDVQIEPLIDGFYAWLYTVAPATSAVYTTYYQLPVLESYLRDPGVHKSAASNPALRGGPFVDLADERVEDVADLRRLLLEERDDVVRLAEAVNALWSVLTTEASGFGLAPLRSKIDPCLYGLVELSYDVMNRATFRLSEPALYRTRYYDEGRQSIDLSIAEDDVRPFFLSTPRLASAHHLQLRLPFRHRGIDRLAEARWHPTTFKDLAETLEVDPSEHGALRSLLTPIPPASDAARLSSAGRVRYFGHACLVLESQDVAVVVDPFISPRAIPGRHSYDDLPPRLHFCLITHGHPDHFVLETLLALRHRLGTVVVPRSSPGRVEDPSLALCLRHAGFTDVVEVGPFDELRFPGGRLVACPFVGEHGDLDISAKCTFAVDLAGRRLFINADSDGSEPETYRMIRQEVGSVDMAFVAMECEGAPVTWLYSPLFPEPLNRAMSASRKLAGADSIRAMDILTELGSPEVCVYGMGWEAWLQHVVATDDGSDSYPRREVEAFLEKCRDNGIAATAPVGSHTVTW